MPETNGTPAETTEPTTNAIEAPASPEAEATAPTTEGKAPKIDGEFDQERAVALIAKLRGEIADLKTTKAAPKDAPAKDDMVERLAALEAEIKTERRKAAIATVAAETGVPGELLVGDDAEALKTYAARLLEWKGATSGPDLSGRPKAVLTPGHGGAEEAPFDPTAVARKARNR